MISFKYLPRGRASNATDPFNLKTYKNNFFEGSIFIQTAYLSYASLFNENNSVLASLVFSFDTVQNRKI
jgi:hypothetical protein